MGNEVSSSRYRRRRDRYDDDDTTIDGTSVFSENTGFSAVSSGTGMGSTVYRSSSREGRLGIPLANILNGNLVDTICGHIFEEDDDDESRYGRSRRRRSKKSHRHGNSSYDTEGTNEFEDDDRHSRKYSSKSRREKDRNKSQSSEESYGTDAFTQSEEKESIDSKVKVESFDSNGSNIPKKSITKVTPLASSFAKKCYFTKAGIGKNMQHYEGITHTGNTLLMLASAMKLKGCPTICDEDLRRVEQTFPNQFSRLPDELLLSSGWRRVSKYCHFSGKAIPDGVPFFHSKERCNSNGGYYFLLAASIGMERPIDVEPLTQDMMILLQTDFPTQCDQTPQHLIEDPNQWTLVTRFCFFSGGPINNDEDVYYKADLNGHPIFMLAFLSPNMTPEELYRLNDITGENALKSVSAVEEVETVYDLTERDFDDLKMYHLGPCRALPDDLLRPDAWEKVLPQHFIVCRENALARAYEYEVHAQKAVARAGKMLGLGTIMEDNQNHNSYVEMHQIGDMGGDFTRSSREFAEESTTLSTEEKQVSNDSNSQINSMSEDESKDQDQSLIEDPLLGPSNTGDDSTFSHEEGINTISKPNAINPVKHQDEHPDDEFQSQSLEWSKSSNSHDQPFDTFSDEMRTRDSVDEPTHNHIQSQRDDDEEENDVTSRCDDLPSTPPESKYLSMQEIDTISHDVQLSRDVQSEEPTISTRDGHGSAKQISSNLTHPTSTQEEPQHPLTVTNENPSIEEVPDDERLPQIPIDSPDSSNKSLNENGSIKDTAVASPTDDSKNSESHHSPIGQGPSMTTMRGARELLKKNREERLAFMTKRKLVMASTKSSNEETIATPGSIGNQSQNLEQAKTLYSQTRSRSVTPNKQRFQQAVSPTSSPKKKDLTPTSPPVTPKSPPSSSGTVLNKANGIGSPTSDVSATSSAWTDEPDSTDKNARRALILKMAKTRMRSKKEVISS